jgi:xylulokinase
MSFLGIDVGTSSLKVVLTDEAGRMAASVSRPLDVSRPRAGWSEQEPEHWIAATAAALDELRSQAPALLAATRGIGLSGQMHGATLLDAADRPLRPAILWNDGRASTECAELTEREPRFHSQGGNLVMPGFTAPKLAWVARHEPGIFALTRRVLLPKDYVRLWLTGEHASDMSDAAGTLWMDVARRDWSEPLLAATGLTRGHMPRLIEGTEASGTLRRELAQRWGIAGQPVVAGGGGDNAASACGIGAVRPGDAFVSLGTSGVLFVSNARFLPNTGRAVHAFCHALPGAWCQMGVVLSAAASLEWLAGITGASASDLVAPVEGQAPPDAEQPLFLPYLSGERTPHNDAGARGAFVGLSQVSDRRALTAAVLEGVAFAFADSLDALRSAGTEVLRATAVGGGLRSRQWLATIASVLHLPIDVPEGGELGGAFGAARLGQIAAEGSDPLAICTRPVMRARVEPDPLLAEALAPRLARWRRLYPLLKEVRPT